MRYRLTLAILAISIALATFAGYTTPAEPTRQAVER